MADPPRLLAQHRPEAQVAFGLGGPRTADCLRRDVATVAAALPQPRGSQSWVVLVVSGDRYQFAVGLLAALARGHIAVLPRDNHRDTILALSADGRTAAVLHDTPAGIPMRIADLLAQGPAEVPPSNELPDFGGARLLLGAGRDSEGCPRRLGELLAETHALVGGPTAGSQRVVSTLPAYRPFGLALGVLWPLCTGGAFCREMQPDVEQLRQLLGHTERLALVSASRHLLAASALAPSTPQAGSGLRLWISAPLSASAARLWHACAGITEVLESPAFAALAFRSWGANSGFAACAPLELDGQGRLLVGAGSSQIGTDIRAEATVDGEFHVLGPAHRVLDTRDGSCSLAQLEATLCELSGVRDAAAAIATSGQDSRVLAACVAAPELGERLEQRLRAAVPAPAAVEVCCVEALPLTEDGRCEQQTVFRLFGLGAAGQLPNYTLDWTAFTETRQQDVHVASAEVHVPDDSAFYDGHFEGYPVLCAAAQLSAIVLPAIRQVRPDLGPLKGMRRLKFPSRIRPGDRVSVELRYRQDSCNVQFGLTRQGKPCSVGQLELAQRGGQ